MKLSVYLGMLHRAENTLAESFRQVATGHGEEPDVHFLCQTLAKQCDEHGRLLQPIVQRYGEESDSEPERLHANGLSKTRTGPVGLLRDLQDLYLLASFVDITWTMVKQAGSALRDKELLDVVATCEGQTSVQLRWLQTRMKQAAPQALVAASSPASSPETLAKAPAEALKVGREVAAQLASSSRKGLEAAAGRVEELAKKVLRPDKDGDQRS